MGKRIVLLGATGMVGGQALDVCLIDPEVASVLAIGRRSVGKQHPKLTEVKHTDFSDCSSLAQALEGQDAALFCIGAYTGAVSDDEFRRITFDYTVAFAKEFIARSPKAAFCLLSGGGADSTGKSGMAFARYKGAAENAIVSMGFARVHIFRPAYIYPVVPREEPNVAYRAMRWLYPALQKAAPNASITSRELAQGMVIAAVHGTGSTEPVLENRDIVALARNRTR